MVDTGHWLTYHAITLKFFPLGYAIIVFLAFTPLLTDYVPWLEIIDPLAVLVGYFALITGIIFLYEVGMSLPDARESPSAGITAAVITAILGIAMLIFGVVILFGMYLPGEGNILFDWIFATAVIGSIIMYTVQGREEFFHSQRFLKNMMDAV